MNPNWKFRIFGFHESIPDPVRFIILLVTAITFQMTGSVYLPGLAGIGSDTTLSFEDLMLLNTASLIGLTVIFPFLFRIKFRFISKHIILASIAVTIAGSFILISTSNMGVLLVVSFIMGVFRLIGTFECISSTQLFITPVRDMRIFFCYVYLVVIGSLQFANVVNAHIIDASDWQMVEVATMAWFCVLAVVLLLTMKSVRFMKPIPFLQMDYLSLLAWSGAMLAFNFVMYYGHRLDWLHSKAIWLGIVLSVLFTGYGLLRLFIVRRPYIPIDAFKYKSLAMALFLFAGLVVMECVADSILPQYTGGFLGYDVLHSGSVNWFSLAGVVFGTVSSYYWMNIYRGEYKALFIYGFVCLVLSQFILYETLVPSMPMAWLAPVYFLKLTGYTVLYIAVTTYLCEGVTFLDFFPGLAIIGVMRTVVGVGICHAVSTEMLARYVKLHRVHVLGNMDGVNSGLGYAMNQISGAGAGSGLDAADSWHMAVAQMYQRMEMQATLLGWRSVLFWIVAFGVLFTASLVVYHFARAHIIHEPYWRTMASRIRRMLPAGARTEAAE